MHPVPVLYYVWTFLVGLLMTGDSHVQPLVPALTNTLPETSIASIPTDCNCNVIQAGNTYPINALLNDQTAVDFYSYGNPIGSSANTGLEESDALVLFLYQDTLTGIVSIFLIADIGNDGTGGSMTFELTCLPDESYVSVSDDPGEFNGSPPIITGNWSWSGCCTDGGVVSDIGCNYTFTVDLLVSSGIDSIVWLTGDINDPDQILLSTGGEAITVNCGGGGVCCPIGLDTDTLITDATCPDTPDGSIELQPQDGLPDYTYEWSNGETTQNITGLLPGEYDVTVTDSQGCTEELQIMVGVSPGAPDAFPADITLCSENTEDVFDLTSVENIVNGGTGYDVIWYENMDLTGEISDPANYLSGSTTVYAVVDNGSCTSEPVPVTLTLLPAPVGTATMMNACEESNGMATFDLTTLDDAVSSGQGSVSWYLDANLVNPISDPTAFFTASTTVYAVINDGQCLSQPVEVILTVDPKPDAMQASLNECGDEFGEAVFDLTEADPEVSGGNGTVEWYEDMALTLAINDPTSYQSASGTVYATVFDGTCYSDAVPVFLVVEETPIGNPITIQMCDDGTGFALFNLYDYESDVSGGNGGVNWYHDSLATDPILNPDAFLTEPVVIYGVVDNGICQSDPVPIQLDVLQTPIANPTFLETCADSTGFGVFNLTSADGEVSGGIGTVIWYEDNAGLIPVDDPTMYMSSGWTVYAQVSDGPCLSEIVPVQLTIVNTVVATSVEYDACDDGSGTALFDLTTIEDDVSNGTGQVHWYWDPLGTMDITSPDSLVLGDTVIYANVTAGICASGIVPVTLMTLPSPEAMSTALQICGDNGIDTFDLTSLDALVSGGIGTVTWYGDIMLTSLINNPASFVTGDTIVFAIVSLGDCVSPQATIVLMVTQGVTATPVDTGLCIPAGDTSLVNLTQYNMQISGGTGSVQWFYDTMATIPINGAGMFPVNTSVTVYGAVTDGVCQEVAPLHFDVLASPVANPFSIKKCGDENGLVTVDLTSVESAVSNNTGTVSWFGDMTLMTGIPDPSTFISGDTIVYAVVTNGFCVSPAVPVSLEVVDSLTAAPAIIQECVVGGNTATVDLTMSDLTISGGSGDVYWFTDNLGTDTLSNPSAFVTSGDTVYAVVAADGCISNVAMVSVEIARSDYPTPMCDFSSIDSLAIIWSSVAGSYELSYTINGQPAGGPAVSSSTVFGLGGLGQGDTLTLSVTALFDSICPPLTEMITCITDVCPQQVLQFVGLKSDYCSDEGSVALAAMPPGGQFSGQGVSGNTFDPGQVSGGATTLVYTWTDVASGCVYDVSEDVQVHDPLTAPDLNCTSASISSVAFDWTGSGGPYGYTYAINQGGQTAAVTTSDISLLVDNLNEGDEVTLMLWTVGTPPCGNSDTVSITCATKICPQVTLTISDPGILCSDDAAIQLDVTITGLPGSPAVTWSGPGITDPSGVFDPASTVPGNATVTVTVDDGGGCIYTASTDLEIQQQPQALFEVKGVPCLDSTLEIIFTGTASTTAQFNWDYDGGMVISGNVPLDFTMQWPQPGDYTLELVLDDNGCISTPYSVPVQIGAPLDTPVLYCISAEFYSLVMGWDDVAGATSYDVTNSMGVGVVSGNTYTISHLPDDTPVNIIVVANGPSACGPSSASIECRTEKFIPVVTFIPNLFSPNHDGINDVLYVQANSQVTEVTAFRVFDRWGGVVFEDEHFPPNDPQHGWDGTVSGKELDPGVFVYFVEVETTGGRPEIYTGDVTLIR